MKLSITSQAKSFNCSVQAKGSCRLCKESSTSTFLNSSEKYQGKNIRALFPETFADPAPPTIFEDIANKHYISAIDQILRDGKDINTALREAEEQANLEIQAALEDMQ